MSLVKWLRGGKPQYTVKFIGIDCEKRAFLDHIHAHQIQSRDDLEIIEKYGCSIRIARALMGQKWFITNRGVLRHGNMEGLMPLHVRIPIDRNLEFLSSFDEQSIIARFRWQIHRVHIEGFHFENNNKVNMAGGFKILFDRG